MYTIKRAAELTSIGVATLRAWERRYGVVAPSRSEGRYRLYSDDDVRALSIMAALVNDGWTASEAAAETLRRVSGSGTRDAAPAGVAGSAPVLASLDELDELIDAAGQLDADRVGAVLDRALGRDDFTVVAGQWLMPVLNAVGGAWADGRMTAAGEHLISYAVQRRLAGLYDAAARARTGPSSCWACRRGRDTSWGCSPSQWPPASPASTRPTSGPTCRSRTGRSRSPVGRPAGPCMSVPRLADVVPAQAVVDRLAARSPRGSSWRWVAATRTTSPGRTASVTTSPTASPCCATASTSGPSRRADDPVPA